MTKDHITILRCAPGCVAAKRWLSETECKDYDCGYRFDAARADLTTPSDLWALLARLRSQPSLFVIRGTPLPALSLKSLRRRSRGDSACFEEIPHHWVMLDIDRESSSDFEVDPAENAARVRAKLPECFRSAQCFWHASGSAGFKPGVRLHLWFWLDRPLESPEVRRWVRTWSGIAVDTAPLSTVQPHYTADPILSIRDPMQLRAGLLPGEPEVRVPTQLFVSDAMREAARTCLARALWKVKRADEGQRNNTLFSQARRVAAWTEVLGDEGKEALTQAAIDLGLAPGEVAATIESAWRDAPVHETLKADSILANLKLDEHGKPIPSAGNLLQIFEEHKDLQGLLAMNVRTGDQLLTRDPPWNCPHAAYPCAITDLDATRAVTWLEKNLDIRTNKPLLLDILQVAADNQRIDPFREYLEDLEWDETPRLETWLIECAGSPDTPFTRAASKRWLISAVARTFHPGCKADHVLILIGEQGTGKSSLFQELAGRAFFTELQVRLDSDDAYLLTQGPVIVELAELASMGKREVEAIKAHITVQIDKRRPKYARLPVQTPRRFIYAGTTNDPTPLLDSTGNRRYWPVPGPRVDLVRLHEIRDQLWAEATALYRAGEKWHLTEAETALALEQQEEARHKSLVEESLRDLLDRVHPPTNFEEGQLGQNGGLLWIQARQAAEILGLSISQDRQLAQAFRALGWYRRKRRLGKKIIWTYEKDSTSH